MAKSLGSGESPQLYFRAEPDLRAAIQKAASEDNRSVSDFMRLLAIAALEARGLLHKRKHRPGRMPMKRVSDDPAA